MAAVDRLIERLAPHLAADPAPLDVGGLDEIRARFLERLPPELRELLSRWNGARFREWGVGFSTGVEVNWEGRPPRIDSDCLLELWGLRDGDDPASRHAVRDLLEESRRHDAEAFLPSGLVAIGRGIQNGLGGRSPPGRWANRTRAAERHRRTLGDGVGRARSRDGSELPSPEVKVLGLVPRTEVLRNG